MRRLLLVLALALDIAAASTTAVAKKPPRCPDSTYLIVEAAAGVPVIASSVTIKGSTVALGPSCPPRKGMVIGTKRGTSVRVKWRRCADLKKVALQALIDKTCTTMSGSVRAKGVKPQAVHGTPPPDTTTTTTTLAPPSTTTTTTPGSATTTTTISGRPCDQSDRDQLEAVTQAGGTLDFTCAGRIELDHMLVVDGVTATLHGFVTIGRGNPTSPPPPAFRLFDVRSGTLVMDGVTLSDGLDLGADGDKGVDGEEGAEGSLGTDGGEGANAMPGGPGGDATAASPGEDGSDGSGGAMLIAAGSTVTLRNCRVTSNVAVGGRGGEGGSGARGGQGGPGGRGGPGPGKNAGSGGRGGDGGEASDGEDGGAGGNAMGGAIDNAGTLIVESCTFDGNAAQGGMAGRGGFGGTGGGGGNGGNGGSSARTTSAPPDNTGKGGIGGSGGDGKDGTDGGSGGDGGSAFGGAIYNTGTLTVSNTTFRSNFATGQPSSFGRTAGSGGEGGDGAAGGSGHPGGQGGDGGHGGNGANGGDNGNGGSGGGGAIFSTTPVTLTGVTFQSNGAIGSGGGSATCVPGDFTCFGAAGDGGLGGDRGLGGDNVPLDGTRAPNGKVGVDGTGGSDGQPGAFSVGVGSDCYAAGALCN